MVTVTEVGENPVNLSSLTFHLTPFTSCEAAMLRIKYGDKYFNDPQLTIECETAWSEDGETRIGTVERWNIRDHVTGASADEVNAALNEFKSALAIDGQDLALTGPSEMQSMRAADIERGPKVVKNTLLDEESVYRTTVWFTVLFEGFRAVVNAVGGIDVYVERPIVDDAYPTDDYGTIHIEIPAGLQHMDGETALRYARSRHGSSDFDRLQRQQQVLIALLERLREPGVWPRLPFLYRAVSAYIETDLTTGELITLAPTLYRAASNGIEHHSIDREMTTPWVTPSGGAVLLPRWEAIAPLTQALCLPR